MKKDQNVQTKIFRVTTVHGNHFSITIMPLDNKYPTDRTIVKDLQIKEIHEISHKIYIVDQTVKTINIETIKLEQKQLPTL